MENSRNKKCTCFELCTAPSGMIKSRAVLHSPTPSHPEHESFIFHSIHTVYAIHPLVTWLSDGMCGIAVLVYRVQYYLKFRAATGGLGVYHPQISGYYNSIP